MTSVRQYHLFCSSTEATIGTYQEVFISEGVYESRANHLGNDFVWAAWISVFVPPLHAQDLSRTPRRIEKDFALTVKLPVKLAVAEGPGDENDPSSRVYAIQDAQDMEMFPNCWNHPEVYEWLPTLVEQRIYCAFRRIAINRRTWDAIGHLTPSSFATPPGMAIRKITFPF